MQYYENICRCRCLPGSANCRKYCREVQCAGYLAKKARRGSSKNHLKGPRKRTVEDDQRFEDMESRVIKLARQAANLDEKGKELLFHWRGGYLTKEVLSELLELFDEEAKAKDKRAFVSVNWPQAVLRVRFADGIGEEQIEMEEANEGEKD